MQDMINNKSRQHWKSRTADDFKWRNIRKTPGSDHTAGDRTRGTDAAGRQLHAGGHPLSVAANRLTNPEDPWCKTKECGVTRAHHESAQTYDQEHDRIDDDVAATKVACRFNQRLDTT